MVEHLTTEEWWDRVNHPHAHREIVPMKPAKLKEKSEEKVEPEVKKVKPKAKKEDKK